MKKEITITHNTTSKFFLTSLQLGVGWPFLANQKMAEALFLHNKEATPQEEKDFHFCPPEMWRGDSKEKLLSCGLEKASIGTDSFVPGWQKHQTPGMGFLNPMYIEQLSPYCLKVFSYYDTNPN